MNYNPNTKSDNRNKEVLFNSLDNLQQKINSNWFKNLVLESDTEGLKDDLTQLEQGIIEEKDRILNDIIVEEINKLYNNISNRMNLKLGDVSPLHLETERRFIDELHYYIKKNR